MGSKVGGRIDKVLVREGDTVKAGQVLITFDDKELAAALDQSKAAAEKAARGYRPEEIAEAKAAAGRGEGGIRATTRMATVARTSRRRKRISIARRPTQRARSWITTGTKRCRKKDLVSKQQRDGAEATWRMADAAQANAQHKLDELKHGYRPEEIASAQARYEQAQATYAKFLRGNRREDVDSRRLSFSFDEARFREREVVAPSDSTVEVLDVRPGDLIAPNTPVATLLERDQIYIRIYIPETEIGHVTLGQKAEVRVDSFSKTFSTASSSKSISRRNFCRAMCRRAKSACIRFSA